SHAPLKVRVEPVPFRSSVSELPPAPPPDAPLSAGEDGERRSRAATLPGVAAAGGVEGAPSEPAREQPAPEAADLAPEEPAGAEAAPAERESQEVEELELEAAEIVQEIVRPEPPPEATRPPSPPPYGRS